VETDVAKRPAPRKAQTSDEGRASAGPAPTKGADLANRLRRSILADGLKAGDPLPAEAELIERYGLSRATVREAIRILDAEGFIEVRIGRNGGIVVAEPEPERLGEWLATQLALRAATVHALVEFRLVIEPVAARLAAQRATPEQLRLLHETTTAATAEEELDFHLYLADASQNELLRTLLRAVHTGLRDHDVYRVPATKADAAKGRRTHRALYEAIVDRDADRAEDLMRRHLEGVMDVVRRGGHLHEPLRSI
jgi:GntR family transcriptional repressor for pyruvate dehydrogenase complex